MYKKFLLAVLMTVVSTDIVLANGGSFMPAVNFNPHCYVALEAGYGISSGVSFLPDYGVNGNSDFNWNLPAGSLIDNDDFGSAPLFGASFGYVFTPNFSLGLSYDWIGNYKYDKFYSSTSASSDSFGDGYYDDGIHFQPLLATLRLNPSTGFGGIIPFMEVGAGVSFNNSGDFNSFNLTPSGSPNSYNDIINNKTMTNFAWKAGLGVDYGFHNHYHFIVGYRYMDVGKIETASTRTDLIRGNSGSIAPLESNNIGINQAYISLAYDFNA